jgi:hypothetical protein
MAPGAQVEQAAPRFAYDRAHALFSSRYNMVHRQKILQTAVALGVLFRLQDICQCIWSCPVNPGEAS